MSCWILPHSEYMDIQEKVGSTKVYEYGPIGPFVDPTFS